ncbi:MAG: hypothetical protein F4X12_13075 [Acidobacteriia bacterium]|nr:hypothetical protein [Terriglobia bacterium]
MADSVRVQVLMPKPQAERFDAFCREMGYKKSPLIARLIREHLDREDFYPQLDLFSREERQSRES